MPSVALHRQRAALALRSFRSFSSVHRRPLEDGYYSLANVAGYRLALVPPCSFSGPASTEGRQTVPVKRIRLSLIIIIRLMCE